MKSLFFSYNPVPTKQYEVVEGSGLRFWRMALGLKANGLRNITIAVYTDFNQELAEVDGIKLTNFKNSDTEIEELIKQADVVVFSAAMGDLSRKICDAANKLKRTVIADAYSVSHIEHLTSSGSEKADKTTLEEYDMVISCFNYCLLNADQVLVANDNQKHLLRGVLSGIGVRTSQAEFNKFIIVPAFVESESRHKTNVIKNGKLQLLWFGAIYPWFNITDLIKVFKDTDIQKVATLRIVGGRNPFYPVDNMRFNGKYLQAVEYVKKNHLDESVVRFDDWVTYRERLKIFDAADAAISINNITPENDYSFRIRIADLAGNGVPVITNGGDPLSEMLIDYGVAVKVHTDDSATFGKQLRKVLLSKDALVDMHKKLRSEDLRRKLHIESNIGDLVDSIGQSPGGFARRKIKSLKWRFNK